MVFRSNAPNPVSLQMLTNQHHDCESLLTEILDEIGAYYSLLKEGDYNLIDREFISVLYRLDEIHQFKSEDEIFSGQIVGVNEIGQLLIQKTEGQLLEFHFKEVEFLIK